MINFSKLIKSFRFAFNGLGYVIKTQNNARFHLLATIVVVLFGIWLHLDRFEWCMIALAIGLVWISECFNTSLEKMYNLVNPNQNELVKFGKDTSAAAVLITAILSAVIGLLIFVPNLIEKIRSFNF